LDRAIARHVLAGDQNLGHLETQAAHDAQELLRATVERGAQAKAEAPASRQGRCRVRPRRFPRLLRAGKQGERPDRADGFTTACG
jgi:hypothetical protein